MSLYDDATFIFSAEAAAGHAGRAHALKPVEKLKSTEYITDTGFDDSGEWTTGTGWSISGGKAVADGTGSGTGADLKNTTADLSGKTVKISFEISDYVQGNVRIYFHGANSTAESSAFSGNGIHTFTHVVTSGHNSSTGPRSFDSFKGKIDNFSIKEVEVRSLDYEVIRDANLTATRVKADGLIEKGRENLLLYSNDFSNSYWTKVDSADGGGTTVTSGQSGYDGSTNAWLLSKTEQEFGGIDRSISKTGVKTFSVYAKSGTVDHMRLFAADTTYAYFDLSGDGSVGSKSGEIEAKIEKVGSSSWFRCSVATSGSTSVVKINPAIGDGDLGTDTDEGGTGTGSIYIQNAQFEIGLVATPYIDSKEVSGEAGVLANEPRYDYLTSTDDCPGALIEPERTNLVPYSEYFGAWTAGNVTVTDNDVKSPEGVVNAAKLLASDDTTAVNHQVDSGDFTIVSGAVTASVFAKKGNVDFVRLRLNGTTAQTRAWFDLENGTVETVDATDSDAFGTIVDMGDGWYKCSVTEPNNTAASSAAELQIFINESDGQTSWIGDGDEYIYVYGAQYEQGPWDTSYIPTHGSSATRENDTYRTPVDTSGVYAQDDFTVFIDYKDFKTHGVDSAGLWRFIHRNVTTRSVFQYNKSIGYTGENHHQYEYLSNQATDGAHKIAVVYNRDSFKVYLDGAESKVDYTVNTDMLGIARSELRYGKSKMTVNRVMVFDRPLTKDEAIALTT